MVTRLDDGFVQTAQVWIEAVPFDVVAATDGGIGTDVGGVTDGHGEVWLGPSTVFDWRPEIWNVMIGRVIADFTFVVEIRERAQEDGFDIDGIVSCVGDRYHVP